MMEVLAELKKRDDQDMHRAVDPLRPAADARMLDSTSLSFEEVVDTPGEVGKGGVGMTERVAGGKPRKSIIYTIAGAWPTSFFIRCFPCGFIMWNG